MRGLHKYVIALCLLLGTFGRTVRAQILAPEDLPFGGEIQFVKAKNGQLCVVQLLSTSNDFSTFTVALKNNKGWTVLPKLKLVAQQNGRIDIRDMEIFHDRLYLAGNFRFYDGKGNSSNCLIYADRSNSQPKWVGEHVFANSGNTSPIVMALTSTSEIMYFGGLFQKLDGVEYANIGRLNFAKSWAFEKIQYSKSAVGTDNLITSLCTDSTKSYLFVGGVFSRITKYQVRGLAVSSLKSGDSVFVKKFSDYIAVQDMQAVSRDRILMQAIFAGDSVSKTKQLYIYSLTGGSMKKVGGTDSTGYLSNLFEFGGALYASGTVKLNSVQPVLGLFAFTENISAKLVFAKFQKTAVGESFNGDLYLGGNFYRILSSFDYIQDNMTFGKVIQDMQRFYGRVFADINTNGKFDQGTDLRIGNRNAKLIVQDGTAKSSFLLPIDKNGIFSFVLPLKKVVNYSIAIENFSGELNSQTPYKFSGDTFNERLVDIPITFKKTNYADIRVSMAAATGWKTRNDTSEMYVLTVSNRGLVQTTIPKLNLNFDKVTNIKTSPSHNITNPGSITWSNQVLAPGEEKTYKVMLTVPSGNYAPGSEVEFTTAMPGLTDDNPSNNTDSLTQTVTNGIAPFVKLQNPEIASGDSFAWFDPTIGKIDYTIRFTNTGTDTANTIVVKDTISTPDYVTYIQETGASHSFTRQVYTTPSLPDKVIVIYTFQNINLAPLPGNNTEVSGSSGFIGFRLGIAPNQIPGGSSLRNRASIYIDNASPVLTNTVVAKTQTAAVQHFEAQGSPVLWPNPVGTILTFDQQVSGGNFSLFGMDGRLAISTSINSNNLDLTQFHLPSGIYLYRITTKDQKVYQGKIQKM